MTRRIFHFVVALPCLLASPWIFAQTLNDPALRLSRYASGFDSPTGIAFLDSSGTALVTEKNTGKVKLVQGRQVTATVLDLPVANNSERGLLSIALSPNFIHDKFVYLYHTTSDVDGGTPGFNQISRYFWTGARLVLDRNVINLPATTGPNHDGGKIVFDNKNKLYAVIGDLNRDERTVNFENSTATNLVSSILRVTPNGRAVSTNPFASGNAVEQKIFAYGIRNSFGIAFDPVTGDLWDTENGPSFFDEINRVTPGFNSGWQDIMGPTSRHGGTTGPLTTLGPRANYQDPKMSWAKPVAPTDLEFVQSGRLGESYRNDMIVGGANTGTLFHFDLTSNRKSLALQGDLADRVADNDGGDLLAEQDDIVLGSGFGVTSDIINGPGGLFVLSLTQGRLYRISEQPSAATPLSAVFRGTPVPEPGSIGVMLIALIATKRRGHARPLR